MRPGPPREGYIPAIDGLRSFAILSVFLFHINAAWLPGGFVGVDIFFVISGFVVAKSVHGVSQDSFLSYIGWFYRRRFMRILPALGLFTVVATLFSALFIPIGFLSRLIEITGITALFGLSNFLLLLKSGDYFSAVSDFNMFTHTWSLGVEEQYYLIFPAFSYLAMVRAGTSARVRRWTLFTVALATVGSLALSALMAGKWPEFAFFMLPTRFWELGAGFLLFNALTRWTAPAGRIPPPLAALSASPLASIAAIGGMLLSFWISDEGHFPWPWAILPCSATVMALAIITLGGKDNLATRLLSWLPLVAIGKLSYSLYLWHWGVIVALRWTIGIDTLPLQLLAIALTISFSFASYILLEKPLRHSATLRTLTTPGFYGFTAIAMLGLAGISGALFVAKRDIGLFAARDSQIWNPYETRFAQPLPCSVSASENGLPGGSVIRLLASGCREAAGRPHVFVLGDSHAAAYRRMLQQLSARAGYNVSLYSMAGCKFLDLGEEPPAPGCDKFRTEATVQILSAMRPGDLLFLPGLYVPRFRDQWGGKFVENSALHLTPEASDKVAVAHARARLQPFLDRGGRVLLELPKPVMRVAIFRCADSFNRLSSYCAAGWHSPRAELQERRARVAGMLNQVSDWPNRIAVWDPFPILCPGRICAGYDPEGKPLFIDADHISGHSNDLLYPSFDDALTRLQPPSK